MFFMRMLLNLGLQARFIRSPRFFGAGKVEVCFVGKRQRCERYGVYLFVWPLCMCWCKCVDVLYGTGSAFDRIIKKHLHQIKYNFPLNVIKDDRNKNVILSKTKIDEQDKRQVFLGCKPNDISDVCALHTSIYLYLYLFIYLLYI